MLNKIVPLLRTAPRMTTLRRMGHDVAHFKTPKEIAIETKSHMNFLPVPEGSWQEAYNKQNARMNALLAASVAFLALTAAVIYQSGAVYLHSAPPLSSFNIKKKE